MRATWMAALLLATALAGCGASESNAGDGTKGSVQVGDSALGNLAEGEGAVRGAVTDDIGIPLAGVKVALVDTKHFDITQDDGRFLFTNVTAGPYELYAEHPDFFAVESPVSVGDQEIVNVTVVLVLKADVGPGYRPHVHDFWGAKTELTVIDGTSFEFHEPYDDTGPYAESFSRYYDTVTASNVHPCVWTESQDEVYFNNRLIWFDERDQLVPPGTAQIEIIIDWSETDYPYHTDFALAWAGANSTTYKESELTEKGTSYFIDVARQEWDSSHQGYSLWELWVCLDTASDEDVPRLFLGSFTATVKLHRMEGPIPPEQAHPVFWPESGVMTPVAGDEPVTIDSTYHLSRSTFNSVFVVRPDDGELVPPGTGHLEARLEWEWSDGVGDCTDWSLTYRPANVRFWDMADPGDMLKPEPAETGAGYAVYEIPLEKAQTDHFYQKKSNWFFMLNLAGEEDDWKYVNPCGNGSADITLRVDAIKREDFAEG